MTARASISPGYRWRLGIIALACLGFAAWFFYDGYVAYPEIQEIHREYERIQAEHPTDFNQRWAEYAESRGWETDLPERKEDWDIVTQFIFCGITLPIGLAFLWAFIRTGGRWIASDEAGLHTSWGQHAPWSALRSIDKARWKTKGIAVVHYDDQGTPRKITLDDWKYEREPTTMIVNHVDERLGTPLAAETRV